MISVIILTKNQEKLLMACLESVKWADEIIVVDDNSTNGVMDIARKYTDKLFVHTMHNFSEQRNFAMEQAKGEWVLYIDPDERVTKTLREEIQSIINKEQTAGPVAYAVSRRNFFLGREQKYVGGWPDNVVRLLKKDAFQKWEGDVHEQPRFSGDLGYLQNPLIHLTHMDITSMTKKTLHWSAYEAQLRLNANHPRMTSLRFFRILITSFFDWYIKKGGYKGGVEGTIESIFQTFSMFFSYVRLWEMQQKPSLSEKYELIDKKLLESDFAEV